MAVYSAFYSSLSLDAQQRYREDIPDPYVELECRLDRRRPLPFESTDKAAELTWERWPDVDFADI